MIALYPVARSHEDAAELRARAVWYFRGAMESGAEVVMFVDDGLSEHPASVFYLESAAEAPDPVVKSAKHVDAVLQTADVVVTWNRSAWASAPAWLRRKACFGDELCDFGAAEAWMAAAPVNSDVDEHHSRFAALARGLRASNAPALILGSGPSLSLATGAEIAPHETVNIYGGSAIDNNDVVGARPPHIIALADIPGQTGPSMTAARRRARVYEVLRRHTNAHVLTSELYWRSLRAWWPNDLVDRVITIPLMRERPLGASLTDWFSYEPTSNVLTTFLLPAAAALSDDIYFAGVDGGGAGDTKWRHDRNVNDAGDLLEAALAHGRMHVVSLKSYYEIHWRRVALERQALVDKGWRIDAPKPVAEMATPPQASNLVMVRKVREIAARIYGALDVVQNHPRPAIALAAAIGACMGGVYSLGMIFSMIVAAVAAAAFAAGYFSLRWRMTRLLAADDRARASAQDRVIKALTDRIDCLEKKLSALESVKDTRGSDAESLP